MDANAFLMSLSPAQQRSFDVLAKAYGAAYSPSTAPQDERLLSLPHFRRITVNGAMDAEIRFLEAFAPEVIERARQPRTTRHDIASVMFERYAALASLMYQDRFDVVCDVAMRLMVHAGRIRTFQTTDALETMLHATDFGQDVPCAWLRLPFNDVYIEFGEHRRFPVLLNDPLSGQHLIEGCYLLSGLGKPIGGGPLVRAFELIIFGSPVAKAGVMDDCFTHVAIPIEDEGTAISELVRKIVAHHTSSAWILNAHAVQPVMEHVAKILVYLGLRDARQREVQEGTESAARFAQIKSASKRAKAQRHAARHYDRIVIGPSELPTELAGVASHRGGTAPHVRRGHFRSQAYGPQYSLRRPTWIEPTLVGRERLNGTETPPRPYVIR